MSFRALVVHKDPSGATNRSIEQLDESRLPAGDVIVAVEYSTLNYKDGLCLGPGAGLVRSYPHVPGIDLAGTVLTSTDARYRAGDKVISTGWRVGEIWWGGYAEKASLKADWLVPLPTELSTRQAMAIGTAGLTSMLALQALEAHGLAPGQGEVLVTGAAGGVGSVALALLAKAGYAATAVTGRPELTDYLRQLGASRVIARAELQDPPQRPLESAIWAGCIDAVGGPMLARVLAQMKYGASVAAVGLAGGAAFPGNVTPFLLRAVNLLGIDSGVCSFGARVSAWERLARDLPLDLLESMIEPAKLENLEALGTAILSGQVRGRVVIDLRDS